jgi:uncharacterized membrane protein YdbT with pleckstrin-like domain
MNGPIILRQNIIFLIYRLFMIQMIFIGSYAVFELPLILLLDSDTATQALELQADYIGMLLLFVTSLIEMIAIIVTVLKWFNLYYEIRDEEIIERRGIISVKENTHSFRNFAAISITQGIIGRIFNFGTIRLYNPALEHSLTLNRISAPLRYKELLTAKLPKQNESLLIPQKK